MPNKKKNQIPITDSISEKNKPTPLTCEYCGKERPLLFIRDIALIGDKWVNAACSCIEVRENEFLKRQVQKETNRKTRQFLRLSSSIEELREYSFNNLKVRSGMETALKKVQQFVEHFEDNGKLGLLIFGESGNGKTHLTASGANELLKQGYSVIFLTEKDLLSRLKETNNFNNEERFFEIMNACVHADLLIWDDFLSSQRLTQNEKDLIFQVVNGRERANKSIWFTSNLTEEEFIKDKYAKVLDDKGRTWSRIVGNTIPIINKAGDYRKLRAIARLNNLSIEEIENETT
ncbi:ATP-binding protein [Priestia megaterium]|uniref:ATP-binding protein n=1 Tax=Priestia megaterium TaxID=1404 RepID=UPI00263A9A81|nr:ATP-binding protein [Priestia megaterium]MDN4862792.1 ATP-binding protein [Priestia megaterium]